MKRPFVLLLTSLFVAGLTASMGLAQEPEPSRPQSEPRSEPAPAPAPAPVAVPREGPVKDARHGTLERFRHRETISRETESNDEGGEKGRSRAPHAAVVGSAVERPAVDGQADHAGSHETGRADTDPRNLESQEGPPYSRPRGDRLVLGEAQPRAESAPRSPVPYQFWPRYSHPAYYPYGYGTFGLGYIYYVDPFWWAHSYPYSGYTSGYVYGGVYPTGRLRLKVTPRNAEVYVDGYFVGQVNDFDGLFERLTLESGPHRIELRAPGYEPQMFEVRIIPGETVTYRGRLQPRP